MYHPSFAFESCLAACAHTLMYDSTCVGVSDCVCEKLIVRICMQYKAAAGGKPGTCSLPLIWAVNRIY